MTVLPANYVNMVPLTNMSMRAGGNNPGRTYRYYTGPVRPAAHAFLRGLGSALVLDWVNGWANNDCSGAAVGVRVRPELHHVQD